MDKSNPEKVIVKDSKHGKGIFAASNFSKGDVIFAITGQPLNFHQTLNLGDNECYCLQVGRNSYIIPDSPFHLSNHSCMPNCGINNRMHLIALCEIQRGEELLWDYSTSMLERHWVMTCKCGYKNCRNVINDFDLLPSFLQNKYIEMDMVMPFILKILSSHVAKTSKEKYLIYRNLSIK
jgi:hypothetical protein